MLIPGTGRPYLDGDSLDQTAPLAFTIADVMSAAECAAMVDRIEALGPTGAPVSMARGEVMRPDIRNNQRVMFDDVALAARLYDRVAVALPALCRTRPVGANERFRGYKYQRAERFAPHLDGSFVRNPDERSELTLMVYLNQGFAGGSTLFLDHEVEVVPRTGLALLFQHRVLHEGSPVLGGTKYVLRSDVMYASSRPSAPG